jgi:Flp pilus assembly protein CpaB
VTGARLARGWRDLRRAVSWHRGLLAAGLAAAAVGVGLHALAPPPAPSVAVVTAAHDLAGGARLRPSDLRLVRLPPPAVPTGAVSTAGAVGRVLAAPVRAGEPLTDVRLVAGSLVRGSAGDVVAAPVRFADAQSVRLLRAGDVVDVIASATLDPSGTGPVAARVVAPAARVLAVPAPDHAGLGAGQDGALVVLALDADTATRVAAATASTRLSFTVRPG